MFKKSFMAIMAVTVLTFISCNEGSKNKTSEDSSNVIFMDLSKNDTTAVYELMYKYFDYLKEGNLDEALGMIHYLDGDSIKDVPEIFRKKQKTSLSTVRAIRYEIDHVMFLYDKDCEVKYSAILFDKEEGDPAPNKISFVIKPVRINNIWYLTMADSDDQNTLNSAIHNN